MSENRPPIIKELWYSIDWSVGDLWSLDLPVVRLPLDALVWHLDVPVWPDEAGVPYTTTPRQVIENRRGNPTEFARIHAADLRFPIDVIDRNGRWMILDGIHRMARAWSANRMEIDVRIVPENAVEWLWPSGRHRRKSEY